MSSEMVTNWQNFGAPSGTDYSGIATLTKMGNAGPTPGQSPILVQSFGRKTFTDQVIKSITNSAQVTFKKGLYQLASHRQQIRDMNDLMKFWYPSLYQETGLLAKADNTFTTLDTAAYNPIYGAMVWSQLSLRADVFRLFDKTPWVQSGWRVKSARGTTANTGGFAVEASSTSLTALPDTVHPTYIPVYTKPKTVVTTFNVSMIEQLLGQSGGDDMFTNPLEQLRTDMAVEHVRLFNEHLLTDVDTLAGNNMESLDRIMSSYDEATNVGIALSASSDADIYGLDRTGSATWADSNVLHNSGTDRDLTIDLLDSMFTVTGKYTNEGDRQAFITGWDTAARISELRSPQVQITNLEESNLKPTINGVTTPWAGKDIAIVASAYRGVPIIINDAVPVDTISRIYKVNLEGIEIRTLLPTQYFEAGVTTTGNPWANDNLGDEGAFVTSLEVIAKQFNSQVKLRDLQ